MSTLTKLELTQHNTRLATENAALRAQVLQLQTDFQRVTSVASAVNTMRTPQWQLDRKEAMDAARQLALVSRTCVKA
jgi:hypothetical protein